MNEVEKVERVKAEYLNLLHRYQKALIFLLFDQDGNPPPRGFFQALREAFRHQPKGITW